MKAVVSAVAGRGRRTTRTYPHYRDSGVEWLGEVPEHWEVKRLEYVASYRSSSVDKKTAEDEALVRLCNYTDVYYGGRIRAGEGEFMVATASASEVHRFRLRIGDILITKDSEDWRDIAVPAIIDEAADDFVCGYHLGIIRSDPEMQPSFLYRALQSVAVNRQLSVSASGVTRYGLSNAAVGDVLLPLPPLAEQGAIAAYLDRETERIDALVVKMRLLIERLGEYRTALITRTVTRGLPAEAARAVGLDPSPPLKPSGVEWLGEVPEHWEVKRLEYVAPRSDTIVEPDGTDELPYVGLEHVEPWTGRVLPLDDPPAPDSTSNSFNAGDVLFGKLRPYLAKAFCAEFTGRCSTEFLVLRPQAYERRYLLYLLLTRGFVSLVDSSTYGAKMPRANWDFVGQSLLPLPPLAEQGAIAAHLDRETERIDALVVKMRLLIERLGEYRTALITAAVTGKIDVRGPAESREAHSGSQLR